MSTPEFNLEQRPNSECIKWNGNTGSTEQVVVGCNVTLCCNNVWINTLVCEVMPDNSFIGKVQGFDGHGGPDFGVWTIGEDVTFTEQNVYKCSFQSIAA